MGWSLGYDTNWHRDIGYGVPAWCDYPTCKKKIDRGLSFVCGGEPYGGDNGCGLYFCDKHLGYVAIDERDGTHIDEDSADIPEDEFIGHAPLCIRCEKEKEPFDPKPEHPQWIRHLLKHKSWQTWREQNKADVKRLQAQLDANTKPLAS